MPSSNGVYSLPPGYLAVTGATIQASQHNPPLEDIAAALTLRLSRDGSAPMTGAIQAAVGSVTLPGVVFQTDASSGFYKTTNGIGVAIGAVKVAEFLAGGVSGAREIGELVPFTGSTVPSSLWVFPVGQTLSRVTYGALWAFAQVEIATGSLLYNNGDGSTTFGIVDMRGRVVAAVDPSVAILTSATMTPDGKTMGAKGGTQNLAIAFGNVPSIPLSVSGTVSVGAGGSAIPTTARSFSNVSVQSGSGTGNIPSGQDAVGNTTSLSGSNTMTGTAGNASPTPLPLLQPTLACNYLLFAGGAS
jgi:microcystin-dependent protein